MIRALLHISAAAAIGLLIAGPALAVGDDSNDVVAPPVKTKTSTECKTGEVFDEEQDKCVDARESSLDDDALYDAARELAWFDRPEEAIDLLRMIEDQSDPDVLNYLGFAHRKAGDVETGLAYYAKALAIDPDHVLARSYLGEAHLELGNIEAAREQLAEIRKRAGTVNFAYFQLSQSLRGASSNY